MKAAINVDKKLWRVIAAGVIGNSLEFYDYALFGYYAAVIAAQFFPSQNFLTALLATYGVFAAGFVMRPLGALIFGYIGDTQGRKKALEISILMMAIPTLMIGLLPGYATIGICAPLLLTLFRLVQGLSVGGELVGSFSYLVEHAPSERRAFLGSWSFVGTFGGKLIAAGVAMGISMIASETALEDSSWRFPFILGVIFALIGYQIRKHVSETPVFQALKKNDCLVRPSPWSIVVEYRIPILQAIGTTFVHTVSVYFIFMYLPVYFKTVLHVSYGLAMASTTLALLLTTLLLPVGGYLADIFGRKPFLVYGSIVLTLLAYPCFTLVNSGSALLMVLSHSTLALVFTFLHASLSTFYVELFPAHIRYTASAIAYNICICVFGGMTPLLCTWLVATTGDSFSPIYWLIFSGLISSMTALTLKETKSVISIA